MGGKVGTPLDNFSCTLDGTGILMAHRGLLGWAPSLLQGSGLLPGLVNQYVGTRARAGWKRESLQGTDLGASKQVLLGSLGQMLQCWCLEKWMDLATGCQGHLAVQRGLEGQNQPSARKVLNAGALTRALAGANHTMLSGHNEDCFDGDPCIQGHASAGPSSG